MSNNVLSQNISDLEASFQMPKAFSNEIEVRDGEKTIVYVAWAYNLRLEGLDIRGNLSLTKYEIRQIAERRRIGGLFSRQFEIVKKDVRREIWHISDKDYGYNFLVSGGKPARNKNFSFHCETALLGKAAEAGILLSDKLLDMALAPIYEKLMEVYRTVKNFGGRGSN
jgi:hypothetical protein